MLERVIENWLAKASENSYKVPFCYMLAKQGHTVVHITRDCALELGKDVLTIDPAGTPCAFQLKGGKITTRRWQKEIVHQVQDLVLGKIAHPSIEADTHESYLVTNGKMEEEVWRAIRDMNAGWRTRNQPELKVIVGGQLLQWAKELQSDLWPTEVTDVKALLELFLEDGKDVFPKARFASLLEATLPFSKNKKGKNPSKQACNRSIASAAILTAMACSNHTAQENHFAEVEAWTLYVSYVLALAQKWELQERYYAAEIDIALRTIKNALSNLTHEVKERKHLLEGDESIDQPFYRFRVTWILAYISIYGLWRRAEKEPKSEVDSFIQKFYTEQAKYLHLWGEAAVPQFLAFYWFFRRTNATPAPDSLLAKLIEAICERNKHGSLMPLPNRYYEAKDILPYVIDTQIDEFLPHQRRMADAPLDDTFTGKSFTLEGLVHLFVRRNWKQEMKLLWPGVTRLLLMKFNVDEPWHFCRWRNREEGNEIAVIPEPTQEWESLKQLANDSSGKGLPSRLKEYPIFALIFICVFPHRANASILRWLDSEIRRLTY